MNRGVEIRLDGRRRPALGDPAAGDLRHRSPDGGDEHRRGQLMRLHIKSGRVVRSGERA